MSRKQDKLRMGQRSRRTYALIEALEGRAMMSGTPLAVAEMAYDGGQSLQVMGTSGNDQIGISQSGQGLTVTNGTGWSQTFASTTGSFTQIVVEPSGGNDEVTLDPTVTVNAVLYAGSGADMLTGGTGNDRLYAGSGIDVLKAGAGNDTLVAIGAAQDLLEGGSGNDSFWVNANAKDTVTNVTPAESSAGAVHEISSFLGTTGAKPASATPSSGTTASDANSVGHGKKARHEPKAKPIKSKKAPKPGKASKTSKITKKSSKTAITNAVASATIDLTAESPVDPATTSAASGYKNYAGAAHPLFSDAGPTANDVQQGSVGDCFYLSVLASVAKTDAAAIHQSVVDLGDGTYAVEFHQNGNAVYVRVNADLPTTSYGSLAYANFGAEGSMWVAVMEKAFTFLQSNAATYKSIDGGWMDESYAAFGDIGQSVYNAAGPAGLIGMIANQLSAGKSVTIAFSSTADGADLVTGHAYTVIAVNDDASGQPASLTIRNPWGVNDASGTGNGYVTISARQAYDSFLGLVSAYV